MHALILCLAMSAPAVDYGWQFDQQNEPEYIIQLSPELADYLARGLEGEVASELEPQARGMRRFALRVGAGSVDRDRRVITSLESRAPLRSPPPRFGARGNSGVSYGWQVDADGQVEYIVQVSHQQIDRLLQGEEIRGEIDREVRNVRKFIVRVGSGPLPRDPRALEPTPEPRYADRTGSGIGGPLLSDAAGGDFQPAPQPGGGRSGGEPSRQPSGSPTGQTGQQGNGQSGNGQAGNQSNGGSQQGGADDDGADVKPELDYHNTKSPQKADEQSQWILVMLTTMGLCASLVLNAYLGWMFVEARTRYHQLLIERHTLTD